MNTSSPSVVDKKGRKHFILVCVVFILPIILAKFALEQQWFNYGVTNQGQLLDQPISLTELNLSHIQSEKNWLLIYNVPAQCESACQQTFNLMGNTYIALGKEMKRVVPVALSQDNIIEKLKNDGHKRWETYTQVEQAHQLLQQEIVLIVDPLGNVVVTHQPPTDQSTLPAFGKAILADMKKLLKYSRIG